MNPRVIGRDGRAVNPIGLGCMGMSFAYGPALPEKDAVALLHQAIELGVDHFDTAELYGLGHNERLLGAAFHDRREKVFVATKFGPQMDPKTFARLGVDGSEGNAVRALEQSLRYLRTDHVDLWYLHRRDFSRPIEETVGAMARAVKAGKVKAIGLSEVDAPTLRQAAAVHPIAALQSEFSIFTRFVEEDGILDACKQLGTTFVAYSPLGRGMLTGSFSTQWKPNAQDFRASGAPRFQGEALANNVALVGEISRVAAELGATPSQVALAWVLQRADHIVTIPGTTKLDNLRSNLRAGELSLPASALKSLDTLAAKVKGERYDETGMRMIKGQSA
jgi:aryl-alcohol dehydrogenase-like predicted oxidoreductase